MSFSQFPAAEFLLWTFSFRSPASLVCSAGSPA